MIKLITRAIAGYILHKAAATAVETTISAARELMKRAPNGPTVKPGDYVVMHTIPEGLVRGLPVKDKDAILKQAKKPFIVNNVTPSGTCEITFEHEGSTHTIWVHPRHLRKLS